MSTTVEAGTETAGGVKPLNTVGEAFDRSARTAAMLGFAQEILGTQKPDGEAAKEVDGSELMVDSQQTETKTTEAEEQALSQVEDEGTETAEAEEAPESTTQADEQDDTLDEELKGKLDEHTQKAINKRIGKEVGKTKAEREAREAAEAKARELEAKLTELQAQKPEARSEESAPQNGPVPLAQVQDVKALETIARQAKQAKAEAQDLLDQLEDDSEGVGQILAQAKLVADNATVADMRRVLRNTLRNAEATLTDHIPARAQYLQQQQTWTAEAEKWLPELKDKTSSRYAMFQQVLRERPVLKNYPDWAAEAALRVLGWERYQEMQAKAQAPAKPAAKREKPVVIPKPAGSAPTKAPTRQEPDASVVDQVIGGNKSARMDYIKSLVPKMH